MKKKKVLFCTESGDLSTGYGNYTRSLLNRLHETGKYEIAELSCYKTCETKNNNPWKVYPNAVKKDDQRNQTYKQNIQNQFGQWRFDLVVAHFKPDVVVDFRDIFMSVFQRTSVFRNKFHWVLAPTIDSFPVRPEWVDSLANCDTLLTHTEWAKKEIEERYSIPVAGVVKDSIDTKIFQPINKIGMRQAFGIENISSTIIGSVMRNQKRKLIAELLKMFSDLIKDHPDTYLYLHTSYPETRGWNIPSLLLEHDVYHRVLFTYVCQNCSNICPMTWKGTSYKCQKCKKNKLVLPSSSTGIKDIELAQIYNMFDIYIQYAICEGFGIPPLEAASCGIPMITMNHGAMKELGEDFEAELIDGEIYRELENSSDRIYPDNKDCLEKIKKLINLSEIEKIKIKEKYRNKVLSKHSWDITSENFEKVLDNIKDLEENRWVAIPKEHFDKIVKNAPNLENHRDLVYHVVDNILQEPTLKQSFFIQSVIKALDIGYIIDDDALIPYDRQAAMKTLEMWFNNKVFLHRFLEDPSLLSKEKSDFLNY